MAGHLPWCRFIARFPLVAMLAFLYLASPAAVLFPPIPAQASEKIIRDIVFDIDYTLAYQIHGEIGGAGDPLHASAGPVLELEFEKPVYLPDGSHALNRDGTIKTIAAKERYRLYDGVAEMLQELKKQPDVRVSFFSGGSSARNQALLEALQLPDGSRASDLAYKTLGRDDLTRVSNTGRFREKYRKDLSKINPNTQNVILVDDVNFAPSEQKGNVLLLKEDFPYPERRTTAAITPELLDEEAGKIRQVNKTLRELLQQSRAQKQTLSAALVRLSAHPRIYGAKCADLFSELDAPLP